MCRRFDLEEAFYSLASDYSASPIVVLDIFDDILARAITPDLILNADQERELHPEAKQRFVEPDLTRLSVRKRHWLQLPT